MQMIPALFASGAGAATGAGAVAAAGSGVSALSILSGAATIAGVLGTLSASRAKSDSYKAQAAETKIESVADDTQAIQRQTAMKRELMRVLGENTVSAAASGIDLGAGLAADTNADASKRAAQELSIDRSSQDARRAMFRARASGFRQLAKSARSEGMFTAFGQAAQGGIGLLQRN